MACLNKSNNDNFLQFFKVSGDLTLSQLQSGGLPETCDNTKVTAPSSLSATANSATQITITWSSSETSFILRRGTTSGSLTQIDTPSSSPYVDTGLTDGTEYFYDVIAVSGSLQSDPSNEDSAITFYDFKQMLTFDGVNDQTRLNPMGSTLNYSSEFTYSIWWRQYELRTAVVQQAERLFSTFNTAVNKFGGINHLWYATPNMHSIQIATGIYPGIGGTTLVDTHADDLELHNYTIVVDDNALTVKMYADGSLVGSTTYTSSIVEDINVISAGGGGGSMDKVGMTEIRMINVAMTDAQVSEEWNNGNGGGWIKRNVTLANHFFAFLFDSTSGTTATDDSANGEDMALVNYADSGYGTQLTVSSESGSPTVGDTVTGGTSGSTGLVVSHSAGDLEIEQIKGAFTVSETVTSTGYSATVDSILTRAWDKT